MQWRKIATGVVLAAAVVYAGVLVHQSLPSHRVAADSAPHQVVGTLPGDQAPNFMLTTLNGKSITLASLKGHGVWLNFWATWCPNCRQELALLEYEQKAYGGKVTIVGVDLEQSQGKVASFVAQRGLTYPIALDSHGSVSAAYGIKGLPTSVFIGPNGTVKAVVTGAVLSQDVAHQYVRKIIG